MLPILAVRRSQRISVNLNMRQCDIKRDIDIKLTLSQMRYAGATSLRSFSTQVLSIISDFAPA
jgi:hypothetical protein